MSTSSSSCAHRPVLLVTGGGRGIGAAVAIRAAAQGYSVAINYATNAKPAEKLVQRICRDHGHAIAIQADISDELDVLGLFETIDHRLGPLAALVNNAGITGGFSQLADLELDRLRPVIDTNIVGALLCAREAVRRMSKSRGGNGGAIVNLSSRASKIGGGGEWIHYAMTKGAIDTLTLGLAREVASEGIRVNAVAPGLIDTELHAAAGAPDRTTKYASHIPICRAGSPDEVAAGVLWLLSEEASYVTGAILDIAGGR